MKKDSFSGREKHLKHGIKEIWNNRKKILEGIKNSIFQKEAIEKIAAERDKTCRQCDRYDKQGDLCAIPGTGPCCGICGCSLKVLQRSLASSCDAYHWDKVLTSEEDLKHEELNPEYDD